MEIKDEDRDKFIEGVRLFVLSKQNLLFTPGDDGFKKYLDFSKQGSKYFNDNFPDVTDDELEDITINCFEIYYKLTNTPIMSLYTGKRSCWKSLLNDNNEA